MSCTLSCHGFYAAPTAEGRVASPEDPDMVPFFLYFDPGDMAGHFRNAGGRECGLNYRQGTVRFEVGKHSADLIAGIDGSRSLGELFESVRRRADGSVTHAELLKDFMAFYEPMNRLDILLLRDRSVSPFREFPLEVVA